MRTFLVKVTEEAVRGNLYTSRFGAARFATNQGKYSAAKASGDEGERR
jgi:hypothetical protein